MSKCVQVKSGITMATKKRLVIDCDPGVDDAQAIMLALAQPEVEVLALTTVEGNTTVDNTTRNALRILNVCGAKVPVYRGSNRSLLGSPCGNVGFHGNDGMGDVPSLFPPDESLLQKEHAVSALIRLARENKGEVTLVAVGPLTNLALAIRQDPGFGSNLKECYIMGGNDTGLGNITHSAEFNFHSDPEAAMVVLNELTCPITVAPWEICLKSSYSRDWYEAVIQSKTKFATFIKEITNVYVKNCSGEFGGQLTCCDMLAVAAAIWPHLVTLSEEVYASVETHGALTRGQMVLDSIGRLGKQNNVTLIKGVDMKLYEEKYFEAMLK